MTEDLAESIRRATADFASEHELPPLISYALFDRERIVEVGAVKDDETWLSPDESPGRFRVASLTKSLTAAAVLKLRDGRRLSLDDAASLYLPEVRGWSSQPTLRQLLTMTAGLPTDNPWADRLQAMPMGDFRAWMASGEPSVRPPIGGFEYSNLGYAMLGLVISEVAQSEYAELIENWFLQPLDMTDSTFSPDATDPRLVTGYKRIGGSWQSEPLVDHGAFSPMGGLVSTSPDIARWATFLSRGFANQRGADSILEAGSRAEMQTLQVADRSIVERRVLKPDTTISSGYGFGLRVMTETDLGTFAGHAGGYPGFGAHMWWHPASGFGIVALANSTYCPVWDLTRPALSRVISRQRHARVGRQQPSWTRARQAVDGLIDSWSESTARDLFSSNVEKDRDLAQLAQELEEMVRDYGPFGRPYAEESNSPGHLAWRRRGRGAEIVVTVLLAPEPTPKAQSLQVELVPDLTETRRHLLALLVVAMDGANTRWPDDIEVVVGLDEARRGMAITSLQYGPVELDRVLTNTTQTLSVQLKSETAGKVRLEAKFDEELIERIDFFRSGTAPVEGLEILD